MYKRALFYDILPQLEHKNAIVITGMRQVGKSTLMKQLAQAWDGKYVWFDLDNPLDQLLFENQDYNAIERDLRAVAKASDGERFLVCIDEIQNFPEITKVIKYLIDHYRIKFIVTGSSNFYLRNLFPESLSGRKFLYILHPLSYREFLHFHGVVGEEQLKPVWPSGEWSDFGMQKWASLYDLYLEFGGFPEVAVTHEAETKRLILKNIFASFFEKDIKVFQELKDIRELRDLLLLLGPRSGNMLDVSRLASELGVNRVKIYNYLEFLEGTFFIRLIPKFTKSIDKSVAGGKKLYFADTGMLNLITKPSAGQVLETAVASQLLQYGQISYYNRRNTAEIDFILNNEIALEVKHKAIEQDLGKLQKLSNNVGIARFSVISKTVVDMDAVIYPWMF